MTIRVYGHFGTPVLAFPCQRQGSDDFYLHGMIDALAPFIESGRIKLFCLDANDEATIAHEGWDHGKAAYLLEQYFQYVIEEVLPYVYSCQGGYCEPLLIGPSSGGTHAANHFFRRPDLFSGFIALSATFDVARFFDGYMDENVYNNSPTHYLENMANDHPYIGLYNQKIMYAVLGEGRFEYQCRYTYDCLKSIAERKGIHIWFNFWDANSVHDWSSWLYQMPYFLERILP